MLRKGGLKYACVSPDGTRQGRTFPDDTGSCIRCEPRSDTYCGGLLKPKKFSIDGRDKVSRGALGALLGYSSFSAP